MAEVVISSVHKCTAPRINPVDKHRRPSLSGVAGRVKVGTIGSGKRAAPSRRPSSAIPFRGHEIPDRNVVMGVSSVPPLTPTEGPCPAWWWSHLPRFGIYRAGCSQD